MALGTGTLDALDAAWALHQRISPDRWCVTRRELHLFVAEVRRRWANGAVPNGSNGNGAALWYNETHEDAEHGPDLYHVTLEKYGTALKNSRKLDSDGKWLNVWNNKENAAHGESRSFVWFGEVVLKISLGNYLYEVTWELCLAENGMKLFCL